jgi:mannose-6-phosphate isomerase
MSNRLKELERMARGVVVFAANEAWRVYTGGRLFRELRGQADARDSYYPEDWIASMTRADNPPRDGAPALEGLSVIGGTNVPFALLVELFPEVMLGKQHYRAFGPTTRVLAKFLDSAVRLPIQAHPDDDLAEALFDAPVGKTEAWIIVGTRKIGDVEPYILLGFKEGIDKREFHRMVLAQDTQAQIETLHRIPVKPGEAYLVTGRTAHAIGSGVFMIEVQQPSDLVVHTERKCVDVEIAEEICHMGLGWGRALEVFDYTGETLEQLMARTRLQPRAIEKQGGGQVSQLIGYERTPHFASRGVSVAPGGKVALRNERFYAAAVVRGGGDVTWAGGDVELRAGDAFFMSNAVTDHEYSAGTAGLEIITAEPPVLE